MRRHAGTCFGNLKLVYGTSETTAEHVTAIKNFTLCRKDGEIKAENFPTNREKVSRGRREGTFCRDFPLTRKREKGPSSRILAAERIIGRRS